MRTKEPHHQDVLDAREEIKPRDIDTLMNTLKRVYVESRFGGFTLSAAIKDELAIELAQMTKDDTAKDNSRDFAMFLAYLFNDGEKLERIY